MTTGPHDETDIGEEPREAHLPLRVTQRELAERWRVSPRTLERWRGEGKGPNWMRICGRVLYRREDVLAFEDAHLRDRTP